jgi:phage-related protein
MKRVIFLGDSLDRIREFPQTARRAAGLELRQLQHGLDPTHWKPLTTVGHGVREIRISDAAGAFRVVYVATTPNAVHVLHAFQKKTQKTPQQDLDLAARRLKQI